MKILEEIKKEHDQIREYFLQMENKEEKAPEIFKELATFVLAHHDSEEKIVFSELPPEEKAQETKNNLIAEHAAIRRTIQIILDTPEDDEMWKSHVHVMKDLLTSHLEEEEHELFELLRDEKEEKELNDLYPVFEDHFKEVEPTMQKKVKDKYVIHSEDRIPKTDEWDESSILQRVIEMEDDAFIEEIAAAENAEDEMSREKLTEKYAIGRTMSEDENMVDDNVPAQFRHGENKGQPASKDSKSKEKSDAPAKKTAAKKSPASKAKK